MKSSTGVLYRGGREAYSVFSRRASLNTESRYCVQSVAPGVIGGAGAADSGTRAAAPKVPAVATAAVGVEPAAPHGQRRRVSGCEAAHEVDGREE